MSDLTPTSKAIYQDIKLRAKREGKTVKVKKNKDGWFDILVDGHRVGSALTDPR